MVMTKKRTQSIGIGPDRPFCWVGATPNFGASSTAFLVVVLRGERPNRWFVSRRVSHGWSGGLDEMLREN